MMVIYTRVSILLQHTIGYFTSVDNMSSSALSGFLSTGASHQLKGLETFNAWFFQSVNNGLPNVSTSFLWSHPAAVGVIWRKLFCVFSCRPLKMCLQLLLWLEKDSSFDVVQHTMQGYCLPVGTT